MAIIINPFSLNFAKIQQNHCNYLRLEKLHEKTENIKIQKLISIYINNII